MHYVRPTAQLLFKSRFPKIPIQFSQKNGRLQVHWVFSRTDNQASYKYTRDPLSIWFNLNPRMDN